jgi:hypothetical protein
MLGSPSRSLQTFNAMSYQYSAQRLSCANTSSMLVRYATVKAAVTEAELSMATTSLLFIGIVSVVLN